MSSDNFSNGNNNSGRPTNGGFPGENSRPRRSAPLNTNNQQRPQANPQFAQGQQPTRRRPEGMRDSGSRPNRNPQNNRYAEERPRNYPRKKRVKVIPILIIAIIILGLAGVGLFFAAYNNSLKPVDASDTEQIMFEVAEGSSTGIIASDLADSGLVRNATFFKMRTQKTGYDGELKPGSFSLSKSMSTDEIIHALLEEGDNFADVMHFTVPEGLTLKQTMTALVEKGIVTEEEFMHEVANGEFDYRFMEYLPEGENRLEGFLYPNTYEIFVDSTAHEVIDIMLSQFNANFTEEHYKKAEQLGMNVLEVVTLASLIERETMVDEERARVAGVIFNRFDEDMMLQIDATIQYILPEVKESLLYSDLEVDSPYNTYKNYGLPPGPICSPRMASIDGALNPEDHDYIFYVLAPELDGSHRFSASASEFEKNKALYYEALDERDN